MSTNLGVRNVAARAIKQQFELAQKSIQDDPSGISAWIPYLEQVGPDLLVLAGNTIELANTLVAEFMEAHMFANEPDPKRRAMEVSEKLSDITHKQHDRRISRDKAEKFGLKIVKLEDDQEIQDAAFSVFHATTHTLRNRSVSKLIENHNGQCFAKMHHAIQIEPIPQAPSI